MEKTVVYYNEDGKYVTEETYILRRLYNIGQTFIRNSKMFIVLDQILISNEIHMKIKGL